MQLNILTVNLKWEITHDFDFYLKEYWVYEFDYAIRGLSDMKQAWTTTQTAFNTDRQINPNT